MPLSISVSETPLSLNHCVKKSADINNFGTQHPEETRHCKIYWNVPTSSTRRYHFFWEMQKWFSTTFNGNFDFD